MDGAGNSRFVLGVECSLSGKRWLTRDADSRLAMAISQRLDLPEIVGRVLAARGIGLDDVETFFEPRLADQLPDPSHLKDMDVAVARLVTAVTGGEEIAVFGDYDVDGATSSALLARFFRAAGAAAIRVYIPDRLKEGYGPNAAALLKLGRDGAGVIITVDCGTTAFDALAAAAEAGIEVIVIDHHISEARLPDALAVVNPNRLDDASPHTQLAAVGIAFLLAVGVNRALRQAGWYGDARPEPDLRRWLDLVALGTVCDVAPLTGLNRAFVVQGLKVAAGRGNLGMAALADVANLDEALGAYHLGFILGPRVNAGGRVGEAGLGARLLSSEDAAEARDIAGRLDAYNRERRDLEAVVVDEAFAQAADDGGETMVFAAAAGWHPGVVGIAASRLVERFGVPACVVALDRDSGVGSGSGRSIPGIDLGAAVIAARQSGLLISGGGHAMAAGFKVAPEKIAALRDFLSARIGQRISEAGLTPTLRLDGALSLNAADLALARTIARLAPFGNGNAEPRFAVSDLRIVKADVVGADHVRLILTGAGGGRLAAIAFRARDTEVGQRLLNHGGRIFHIAGKVRENNWAGRSSVQLIVDDAAGAG